MLWQTTAYFTTTDCYIPTRATEEGELSDRIRCALTSPFPNSWTVFFTAFRVVASTAIDCSGYAEAISPMILDRDTLGPSLTIRWPPDHDGVMSRWLYAQ